MGLRADPVDALDASDRVSKIVSNDEVIEAFAIARRELGGKDGAVDHAKEARFGNSHWLHVPVARQNAGPVETSDRRRDVLTHHLVFRIHANGISHVNGNQKEASFGNRGNPCDANSVGDAVGNQVIELVGDARSFARENGATSRAHGATGLVRGA